MLDDQCFRHRATGALFHPSQIPIGGILDLIDGLGSGRIQNRTSTPTADIILRLEIEIIVRAIDAEDSEPRQLRLPL
jgi:hypothetical protein